RPQVLGCVPDQQSVFFQEDVGFDTAEAVFQRIEEWPGMFVVVVRVGMDQRQGGGGIRTLLVRSDGQHTTEQQGKHGYSPVKSRKRKAEVYANSSPPSSGQTRTAVQSYAFLSDDPSTCARKASMKSRSVNLFVKFIAVAVAFAGITLTVGSGASRVLPPRRTAPPERERMSVWVAK